MFQTIMETHDLKKKNSNFLINQVSAIVFLAAATNLVLAKI